VKTKPGDPDFSSVTEAPGLKASPEQLTRLYHRYRFALDFCEAKDVLEVACGSGLGLGFMARKARCVVGGDIDEKNIRLARRLEKGPNTRIIAMDAHRLPFRDRSFDVLLLFEAIYYFESPEAFILEANRVLRPRGTFVIGAVNGTWPDLHPSPFARRYFSVPELVQMMEMRFSRTEAYGAFWARQKGISARCLLFLKRMAVKGNLIPGSLAARAYLKRLFYGPLQPVPDQVREGMSPYDPPAPIRTDTVSKDYVILYVVGHKN
jgi:SAM-dependent methyltransferase